MTAKNKFITFIFLVISLCCAAQTGSTGSLRALLDQISKDHNVKFSMIDEEVAMYNLAPPSKKASLQEKINYIKSHTRLKFESTGPGRYTVYNDVSAQNPLCGYLIDKQTGKGVSDAVITVGRSRVTSDANGYFSIPKAESGKLVILAAGYLTHTIDAVRLYIPGCLDIPMYDQVTLLDEVVAERYLATGISRKDNGTLIIRPQRFGILPGLTEPDVLQTMQQLPGVISIDETVSNINVRGGTHDQNLFLWNGIRMFQTSHFFGLLSAFNPLQASEISIYKNGSPASFGESVSSAVNITTHTPFTENRYTFAADLLNTGFHAAVNLSANDALQVSGRRSYSDVWGTPTFKAYERRIFQNTTITDVVENEEMPVHGSEDFYFYDLSLSYRHAFNEKHVLYTDAIAIKNSLDIFQQTETSARSGSLAQDNFGGSLIFDSQWNENHYSDVQVYYSYHSLDGRNEALDSDQVTQQNNTIKNKGLRLNYDFVLTPRFIFGAGYQLDEMSVRNFDEVNLPEFSKNDKVVYLTHAAIGAFNYISDDDRTKINVGIRGNYFAKYQTFLAEPRLTVTQSLQKGLTLTLAAEQKSQTLSQVIDRQQDFLGIEKRRWVLAGDNIPIQKGTQASIGISYTKNGWLATAEGFYKKVKGITSNSQGFQNQFEFEGSTGTYKVLGYELLVQKKFDRFYSWASYSYNDNDYNFDSFLPPGFRNNFAVSHSVTSAAIYEHDGLRLALGTKWRTGSPQTEPLSFTIDPDNPANSQITYKSPNSSRLGDNVQVNFSASKTWDVKSLRIVASCSVLNIFDRENVISRYYRINKTGNTVESVNTYGLGITPNVGVKLQF